jgi:hypothetical protein
LLIGISTGNLAKIIPNGVNIFSFKEFITP